MFLLTLFFNNGELFEFYDLLDLFDGTFKDFERYISLSSSIFFYRA